jgi:hypothetical protein
VIEVSQNPVSGQLLPRSRLSGINLPAKWLINAVGSKGVEQSGGGIEIPDAGALIAFALRKF